MITKEEVLSAQKEWADWIIKIGTLKENPSEYKRETESFITKLYNYDNGKVLFKPTRASVKQFRLTKEGALSYFVGGNSNFPEDTGFALQPWTKIKFENADIIFEEELSFAMGNYYLTDLTGKETKIEFMVGYVQDSSRQLKINIHHSSFPYIPKRMMECFL